jgi:hypothetical protein
MNAMFAALMAAVVALVSTVIFALNAAELAHWRSSDASKSALSGSGLRTVNLIAAIACGAVTAVLTLVFVLQMKKKGGAGEGGVAPSSMSDVITPPDTAGATPPSSTTP